MARLGNEDNQWDTFSFNNKSGTRLMTWGALLIGVILTLVLVINSNSPLFSIVSAIFVWSAVIFFWRRRKYIAEWNGSEVPLKDFIAAKQEEEAIKAQEEFKTLPDNAGANLSKTEEDRWKELLTDLNSNGNPKDKKRRKDK